MQLTEVLIGLKGISTKELKSICLFEAEAAKIIRTNKNRFIIEDKYMRVCICTYY